MQITLSLKNYRCFVQPVELQLRKGFTAFVGVNNAGKSTMLRFLLEFRDVFSHWVSQRNLLASLHNIQPMPNFLHVVDQIEIFSNINDDPILFKVTSIPDAEDRKPFASLSLLFIINRGKGYQVAVELNGEPLSSSASLSIGSAPNYPITYAANHRADADAIFNALGSISRTLYIGSFRNTINVGSNTDYLDIQIGQSFISRFRQMKMGPSKHENTAVSELTERIRTTFRFDSLDISPAADDTSIHITINRKPYKQHEIGSGITHFIIALVNAAIKRPDWILIDEPELNLHPALQLDFLTSLGAYAKEGVWFSTHSLGLARSSAEVVYTISRIGDGNSVVRSLDAVPRLAEFLGEMSFSSHKELGFETVMLVEGPTEVKVIQHFLRLIGKDHKVLLLPIHGHMPKADELEEILRITPNIVGIIDSEKVAADAELSRSRRGFLDLCSSRGIKAKALDFRATENYFPDAVVKSVFGGEFRSLAPYEKLTDAIPHWHKSQNWKLAQAMSFDDISETDFGQFLQEL